MDRWSCFCGNKIAAQDLNDNQILLSLECQVPSCHLSWRKSFTNFSNQTIEKSSSRFQWHLLAFTEQVPLFVCEVHFSQALDKGVKLASDILNTHIYLGPKS